MNDPKQAWDLIESCALEGYELARAFVYRDKDGNPAQLAARYEPIVDDGKRSKQFKQFSVDKHGKPVAKAIANGRPLYNLPELIANPDNACSSPKARRRQMPQMNCSVRSLW